MSTPIETNTEELQEILQTVYNLPNAGGGSSEPDLVITLTESVMDGITNHPEKISFNSEEVVNAYTKLLSGETVNCVLNADYFPDSGGKVKASSPQITAFAKSEDGNSARVGYMNVFFNLWYYYGWTGSMLVVVGFDIHHDGTVSITGLEATRSVGWVSAYL